MSSEELSSVDAADSDPLPGVPDVEDPQPSTPLTEDFVTGTANDPEVGSRTEGAAEVTVDGQSVALPPGSTIGDALDELDTEGNVPALCDYDRDSEQGDNIGPRSECRTCVVRTEEHGIVPSCSFPVEDGMTVRTDDEDAANMRDVNLDLTLSNHNLRCTTCGQNGRCELQDASIENDVHEPRYGVFEDRDEYVPLDDSSSVIQIDRNKCILCNRCVEACNDVQVEGVLRMEGDSGQDLHIDFQNGADKFDDSTCVDCGHCATVCPTGSLVEKGLVDAATLPIPGFSQKNSIGKVIEHVPVETAEVSDSPNRNVGGDADGAVVSEGRSGLADYMAKAKRQAREKGERVGKTMMQRAEHVAEDLTSEAIPAGWLFGIATTVGDARLSRVTKAETTCNYCAVGCRFELYGKDGEVLGVRPTEDDDAAPANDFSTCVKGKFGYDFANSEDRLDTPLIKEDGEFREATWEEAIDEIYENLTAVREEYGTDSIAVTSSSKATNEENFLNQKFARQVLQTPHVDNCARLCHSSTVAGLQQTVGYGAMATRINEDVGETDCYLITGSNTTESHPVLATRIKQNARDGADLFVFDPRKVGLAEHATQYSRTRPGSDIAWINGMIHHIISEDLHDEEFIENRTKHFDELKEKVEPFTPERVEELSSVPPEELKEAAETIATADTCIFGWAMGMTQHAHGTRNVLAMTNLALVTGHMGKPGAGLSPFRGQNNVQGGGGDMGPAPHTLPGYQDLQDDEVLDKFEAEWGVRPPDRVGLRLPEQYEAMLDDELHGMYIMGENPALSEPNSSDAQKAVQKLDFLAVQDIFLTETAQYADVVLPAASAAEKSGTFTNTERRIQRVRPAIDPPGQAKSDMDILIELAERFGYEWDYDDPSDVMEEISSLVPIYGGVDYDRLAAEEGSLQWPVWDTDHTGTPYLYEEEFNFEDGRARFVPADYAGPTEMPDEEYPLMLTTGRVLYHWHTGTMTRRVEALMHSVPESFVTIHPNMAETLGIADGEYVRVSSRRGSIVVRADVEETSDEGVVFIPMHFARGAVNELTSHETDPTSFIPEYKVSSVRIEPLGADPDEEPMTVEMPGDATGGREERRDPPAGESGADD